MTNTVSSIYGGSALSKYFDSQAIKALFPNIFFKDGSRQVNELPKGQNKYVYSVVSAATSTVAGFTLTEGTTPSEGTWVMTQVEVSLVQLGQFVKFSDIVLSDAPVALLGEATYDLAKRLATVADIYIQDQIDGGTNVIYAGAATSRVTVSSTMLLTATLLAKAVALLRQNSADTFDGGRMIAIASPMTLFDLRTDTATGGWLDANKYVTPEKIFRGEVGSIAGARVIESPNIQFYANAGVGGTVDVYPTFVFGRNAYGVVMSGNPETIVKMPGSAGSADPLNQQASVGVKLRVGSALLRSEAMYRVESASSIGAN